MQPDSAPKAPGSVTLVLNKSRSGFEHLTADDWALLQERLGSIVGAIKRCFSNRPQEDIEEAVQDAHVDFVINCSIFNFERRRPFFSRFRTVAHNALLNLIRGTERPHENRKRDLNPEAALVSLCDEGPPPDARLKFADLLENLYRKLPTDNLRRIVKLRLDGVSRIKIAEIVRCSPSTIDNRLHDIGRVWEEANNE